MTRRLLLHALAVGVRAGTIEATLHALRGYDPWLAARARRRLRALLRHAGTLTSVQEPPHLLRLAYLLARQGYPSAELDDVAAITAEQERAVAGDAKAGSRPPRRGAWLTGAALGLLVLAIAAVPVARWWTRPFDPRQLPAGAVLAGPLPELLVAVARSDADGAERAMTRVDAHATRRALGDEGVEALLAVMAAARAAGGLPAGAAEAARHRLTTSVVGLDRALERRGLPFFVDELSFVESGRVTPFLMSFYVERELRVTAAEQAVRVVHLWRLDSLNLSPGYVGYTQAHSPAALVLLDQVESDLVRYLLPALPEGETLELVDPETRGRDPRWAAELEVAGAALVRRWLAKLPPDAAHGAVAVGRLLARRRALVHGWQRQLTGSGRELRVPMRLIPEAAYATDLARRVPRAQLYEWEALHRELVQKDRLGAFLRLREIYVANVQRHEIEHRLDYTRGLVPLPLPLTEALGVGNRLDVPEGGLAARSRQELRAYLAEAAQAPHSPVLSLVLLARNLFAPGSRGGPYWYASRVIFQGLADELGITVQPREPDQGRLADSASLFRAVMAHDDAALVGALERFHARAFSAPIPVVQVTAEIRHRPWRR